MNYEDFVASKLALNVPTGIANAVVESEHLFPFQRDLTQWALRRGRCALFANMGLGKSRMALFYARAVSEFTAKPVIILTPLAVAQQMRAEGGRVGIRVTVVREHSDVCAGVNVCNYERLAKLDASVFGGAVFDESSCVKGLGSKTLTQLVDAFGRTPFRLACSATPAPNSFDELGQHCELLGICSRNEMLAEHFQHDGSETSKWILKGHARKAFWKFVASWGALVRSPEDIGHDGSAYELPPIEHITHVLDADADVVRASGFLFAQPASTLMERRAARRGSMERRVSEASELVNADNEPWICWCDYNEESTSLTRAIRGAVEVTGSMDIDDKEEALRRFIAGEARVLVTKPSLAGHGLNLQHCNRVVFAGISDSYEQRFQAIGRVHRFGQKRPVAVHYYLSELEMAVLENIKRKSAEADAMAIELALETRELVRAEVTGQTRATNEYVPTVRATTPDWLRSEL